ncbi:MAG: HNH endonuclease [Candidatus Methanomethylophilaceae archaeon]|nr:HNH endonuclease [Candidatus Methanomethylophilaceae archaeon]
MAYSSYSWTVVDEFTAIKHTDMSVFKNHGSAVPVKIRGFFGAVDFVKGQSETVTLVCDGRVFKSKLGKTKSMANQVRIMWGSDFSDCINRLFPDVLVTEKYPDMTFTKKAESVYEVSFSPEVDVGEFNLDDGSLETIVSVPGNPEGRRIAYYTTKYERDPENRRRAIQLHGARCMACGFDFEETYGELGRGFIEVHHVKPLYDLKEETVVDPSTDLVCICPNCHRMVHRKKGSVITMT